ncbi:hypothetical protein U1Q18_019772 [Sarracenia purpurea var. burkii]
MGSENRFGVLADVDSEDALNVFHGNRSRVPVALRTPSKTENISDLMEKSREFFREAASVRYNLLTVAIDRSLDRKSRKIIVEIEKSIENEVKQAKACEPTNSAKLEAIVKRLRYLKSLSPIKLSSYVESIENGEVSTSNLLGGQKMEVDKVKSHGGAILLASGEPYGGNEKGRIEGNHKANPVKAKKDTEVVDVGNDSEEKIEDGSKMNEEEEASEVGGLCYFQVWQQVFDSLPKSISEGTMGDFQDMKVYEDEHNDGEESGDEEDIVLSDDSHETCTARNNEADGELSSEIIKTDSDCYPNVVHDEDFSHYLMK